MGTQKNGLNETVLSSTENICLNRWVRIYLQFYAQKVCLTGPMNAPKSDVMAHILVGVKLANVISNQ